MTLLQRAIPSKKVRLRQTVHVLSRQGASDEPRLVASPLLFAPCTQPRPGLANLATRPHSFASIVLYFHSFSNAQNCVVVLCLYPTPRRLFKSSWLGA
jgi:hypothetical protein